MRCPTYGGAYAITGEGLALPGHYAQTRVVDCKSVGMGEKALMYLGRYLYRGVIMEQDTLARVKGLNYGHRNYGELR